MLFPRVKTNGILTKLDFIFIAAQKICYSLLKIQNRRLIQEVSTRKFFFGGNLPLEMLHILFMYVLLN